MTILALTTDPQSVDGWGRYTRGLLHSLAAKGIEIRIAGKQGSKVELAVLPDPLSYGRAYWLAPWYAWRLRKEAVACDVIHALVEPYSRIAYWLSLFARKPYAVTAHGTFALLPFTFGFPKRLMHAHSFARASAILCVSRYTKQQLEAKGLMNLVVIPNGLDTSAFGETDSVRSTSEGDYILSVGVLKPRKGLHVSLAAFARAHKTLPGLRYRIVGSMNDAAYAAHLQDLASRLGVSDAVEFLGEVSEERLRTLYRGASVFVLTPTNEGAHFEGFGLVYLEAGAHGTPVIGTRDTGAEDAVQDGVTGFLVPQNDPAATAEAIVKIVSNRELSQEMGARGKEWSFAHDWANVAEKYQEAYAMAAA